MRIDHFLIVARLVECESAGSRMLSEREQFALGQEVVKAREALRLFRQAAEPEDYESSKSVYVINGVGGGNRYAVRRNGEVELSKSHASPAMLAHCERVGFPTY